MISEIFRKHNLIQSKTSDWIPMSIENLHSKGKFLEANSVTILWENAAFNPENKPGTRIECSEDGRSTTFMKSVNIDSESNTNDVLTLVVTQLFKYVRFVYTSGSATLGNLNIFLNYR